MRLVAFFLFFVAVLAVSIAEMRGRTSPLHRLKSESTRLSKKKIAENAASRPNFGDFFGWRAPPPAARRHAWADGGYFGYWRGRSHWTRLSRSWSSRPSSWDLRGEVVVMVVVVVRAGDGAASAVSVDRERDAPRPRLRAAPPPRGRRVRASRSVPPAFSCQWSARCAQVYVYSERRQAQPRRRRGARRGY